MGGWEYKYMWNKFEIHDKDGNKIGTAEREPSTFEQVIGYFILFWLIWKLIEGFIALFILLIQFLLDHPKFALTVVIISSLFAIGFWGIYKPIKKRNNQQATEEFLINQQIYQSTESAGIQATITSVSQATQSTFQYLVDSLDSQMPIQINKRNSRTDSAWVHNSDPRQVVSIEIFSEITWVDIISEGIAIHDEFVCSFDNSYSQISEWAKTQCIIYGDTSRRTSQVTTEIDEKLDFDGGGWTRYYHFSGVLFFPIEIIEPNMDYYFSPNCNYEISDYSIANPVFLFSTK